MDITNANFAELLPTIIETIHSSIFITFDLELSGIHKTTGGKTALNRKQRAEERYVEIKEAAERFQVLQFGLCAVFFDDEHESYICRPYNFHINPSSEPKFGLDREYSVQASALGFLTGSGFNLNAGFTSGVPYLSRYEEKRIVERENLLSSGQKEDIYIDEASEQFVQDFVSEIQDWVDDPNPLYDFLNISTVGQGINGYQKRIVHQVVRSKFPGLTTLGKSTFVQVVKSDPVAERLKREERRARFDRDLQKAVGLRHVVEAIFASGKPLVGHNLFTDLINLYHCFIGSLPATAKEFGTIIHKTFPIVVDTKYIATCDEEVLGFGSSLQGLWETLCAQFNPTIELDVGYCTRYAIYKPAHEAGYDSYNTAQVLIKLAGRYHAYHLSFQYAGIPDPEAQARKMLMDFVHGLGNFSPPEHTQPVPTSFPGFDSDFWDAFSNVLKVNGTVEGVWLLE